MDRLTVYIGGEAREDHSRDTRDWKNGNRECMDRLAAYEDTGMMPDEVAALRAENERLSKWVDDLQSGMYVNCVYCGHRYGPGETTPVSMADALKAHVEQCPKHPMSALKAENERLRNTVSAMEDDKINYEMNLEHLTAEAEQYQSDIEAGRMLRLPAAIGQLVYVPSGDGGVYTARVKGIGVLRPEMHDAVMLATVWVGKGNEGPGYMIGHENKGTYWFETEAEARAALEGGQR